MNDEVEPGFIVQLGDLNDSWPANCSAEVDNDLIVGPMQRARSCTEEKTDIPWFDVIGNHEFASGYRADGSVIEGKDFSVAARIWLVPEGKAGKNLVAPDAENFRVARSQRGIYSLQASGRLRCQ